MVPQDLNTVGLDGYGKNVLIYQWVRLTAPERIRVGSHVIVDDFVFLQGGLGLTIGDHVHIASFASIVGGGLGIVGDFATVSSGARVLTGTDVVDGSVLPNSTVPDAFRAPVRGTTRLEPYSFVGANAVIMPNVRVGQGAVIGAASAVFSDVEPWTINVGAPARPVKSRPRRRVLELAARLEEDEASRC
jgi:galactoside O-acetyltransferase